MFAQLERLPAASHVFQAINIGKLASQRMAGASTFTEAAIQHLRGGISKLVDMVRQGNVILDVRLCAVELKNPSSVAAVAALNPYNITWNNVCDYFDAKEFHDMARACSGSNTVHHAYSMNWVWKINGTFCLDLMLRNPSAKEMDSVLSDANAAVEICYTKASKCRQLLLVPPVDDSRNIIDFSLALVWYKEWLKSFFESAHLWRYDRQVRVTQVPLYSPLTPCSQSLFFSFTYDPEISFYDFAASRS